ncbi:MAG: hypothetical protein CMN78_03490 [Spirochaetales bacterium]|nr:hypothetical protein [Spirochaetales bacterium]
MLQTAIAHSTELDSQVAVEEVLKQTRETLGELRPQAGMLFAGINHNFKRILGRINETYPGIELIGCTTDGEMSSVHGFTDDSIVLTLFYSEELSFKAGMAEGVSEDPYTSLKKAIETARSSLGQEPKLCIVTPQGLMARADRVLEGLQQGLGENFPIFGGCAADQYRHKVTYQFYKNEVFADAVPFLLLAGGLLFSFGAENGWMPVGSKARVTRSDQNTVYRIGNRSATDFFEYYIGEIDWPIDLPYVTEYPLAVFEDDRESFYLPSIKAYDEEKGSITFGSVIPEGVTVQIAHTTRDNIIEAAKKSVHSALTEYPGSKPSVAFCFSCAIRKEILGTRIKDEYEVLQSSFPNLPIAGFYTYGELGPLNRYNPSRYHSRTFVTLLIGLE